LFDMQKAILYLSNVVVVVDVVVVYCVEVVVEVDCVVVEEVDVDVEVVEDVEDDVVDVESGNCSIGVTEMSPRDMSEKTPAEASIIPTINTKTTPAMTRTLVWERPPASTPFRCAGGVPLALSLLMLTPIR
jgi:hypothetical protein